MKSMKQALALLLCFLMLFSAPVNALATGDASGGDIVIVETENTTCDECGSSGAHTEECSLYTAAPASTACSECGQEDGHAEICSQYVAPASTACTECGLESGHAETCSQYEVPAAEVCSECGAEEGHAETCSQYETPAPTGCAECGQEEDHAETGSQYEAPAMQSEPASLFPELMAAESAEKMFELMNENIDAVWNLTFEEVEALRTRIAELEPDVYAEYLAGESGNESYAMEVLFVLETVQANLDCSDCGMTGEHAKDCPWVTGDALDITGTGPFPTNGVLVNDTTYELTDNVRLNPNNLKVPEGVSATIDLNGMVLVGIGTGHVITVEKGASLTIIDSNPTKGHNGNITDRGLWEWAEGNYAGQFKGGFITNKGTGQGIMVNGGTVTMTGGTIAGCYSEGIGAAVTATSTGTFIMTGGRIMYNVTESNGSDSRGGAVYGEPAHGNRGSYIDISNAQIFGNTTSGDGGAICGYIVTLKNTTVSNNTSSNGKGGGIYVRHANATDPVGKLTIDNCQITSNTAKGNGGGICADTGTVTIISNGSAIDGNTTSADGGGIYAADLTITGTSAKKISISDNDALGTYGGGIFVNQKCTITYAKIDNNYVPTLGGGIHSSCNITITDSDVINNCAMATESGGVNQGRGGGINVIGRGVNCTLTRTNVTGNTAMYYGGGVQVREAATLELVSGKISNNTAIIGGAGGVHVSDGGTLTMTGGEISDNVANSVGGGIHSSYQCTLNLKGGAIKGNVVHGRGGGVHVNTGGNLALQGVEISGNKAYDGEELPSKVSVDQIKRSWKIEEYADNKNIPGYGGGVLINAGTCTMSAGTLSSNFAETGGGGIAFIMSGLSTKEDNTYWEFYRVVTFTQSGGVISGNSTNGNGGAIYLMKNMLSKKVLGDNAEQFLNGIPAVTASGGIVTGNSAIGNGGAVYQEEDTKFIVSGNTEFSENTAQKSGGAVYIAEGTAEINGGIVSGNEAKENGGALYISGHVTMNGGTMSSNTAAQNGGAAYVSGGNFDMLGGTLGGSTSNANKALNGGAVYVIGGNFEMISGVMSYNVAEEKTAGAAEAGNEGYGGAVYAAKSGDVGGSIIIGVKDCDGSGDNHSVTHTGLAHPKVTNNEAEFGGGFAVSGGSVSFYCGIVNGNKTDSDGTGKNVFMQDGSIVHYMDEASIGTKEDHGMVSTGGTLTVYFKEDGTQKHFIVQLIYNANLDDAENANFDVIWEGEAPNGYYLNLPYCPTTWQNWQATNKLKFVGWTETPINVTSETIRSADDYNPIGKAVEIRDTTVGDDKNIMRFYAVWAPETSAISYAYIYDGANIESFDYNGPKTYDYTVNETPVNIGIPQKPGYRFAKWILYADYGTDKNNGGKNQNPVNISNWNSDAETKPSDPKVYADIDADTLRTFTDGTLSTLQNFGDITLVAIFEPQFTDLTITVQGSEFSKDPNQSFIFTISGDPLDASLDDFTMDVVITADKEQVTVKHLPVGDYTVTEKTDWSWRYAVDGVEVDKATSNSAAASGVSFTMLDPETTASVTFTQERTNQYWLSGDAYCANWGTLTGVQRKDD